MIDYGKKNVLGVRIDAVDYEAAVTKIMKAARERRSLTVSALAVHGVMTGVLDKTHRYRLNQLDLVVPDGQPVRWALNMLYKVQLPDRVYGPILTLKVCEQAAQEGTPVYLYGSKPPVLENLVKQLCSRFPDLTIAGTQTSRFRQLTAAEKMAASQEIADSGAAITLVGLGCPRQEVWIYEHREVLSMPLLAVGAAFDFHAGTLAQAPRMLQGWGLEWLYRLLREPSRLWRRYIFLNPLYLVLLALQILELRHFDPSDVIPPVQEIRYG